MSENEYFNNALSDFVFDVANGRAIRHFTELGYTVKQIMEKLDISAPYEKVRQTVWDALVNQQTILLEEPCALRANKKAVYVKEYGAFGRTTFRRILTSDEAPPVKWKKIMYKKESDAELIKILSDKCRENGTKNAYVSCDFGIFQREEPLSYQKLTARLGQRQKDYTEGLPWPNQRVYHRMDTRMTEMISCILSFKEYSMNWYFGESGDKIIIY